MSFWDYFFTPKNNFYEMLHLQSRATLEGIGMFTGWIKSREDILRAKIWNSKDLADEIRFDMEKQLVESFSTPFDRQDIYTFSVEMNKIFRSIVFALRLIDEFKIGQNEHITRMGISIFQGFKVLDNSLGLLEEAPMESQDRIKQMRLFQDEAETSYILGMKVLLNNEDLQECVNMREVFLSLREANNFSVYTVDIFHRIVVRII